MFLPKTVGLPTARELSNAIAITSNATSTNLTHMFMALGLFLDHDIAQSPGAKDRLGLGVDCCQPRV